MIMISRLCTWKRREIIESIIHQLLTIAKLEGCVSVQPYGSCLFLEMTYRCGNFVTMGQYDSTCNQVSSTYLPTISG